MNLTDDELLQEIAGRLSHSRKAFEDLVVLNRKLMEMNQKLEQSEALKSNFLSNVRNEINNPLNVITCLARQLMETGGESQDVPKLAALICHEANTLDFQLRNIMIAAELEAGIMEPSIIQANVAAIIKDQIEMFSSMAARKSVTIRFDDHLSGSNGNFGTDPEKLKVIISNLLVNAVEYSKICGLVEIVAEFDATKGVEVSVSDHGVGIAPENHQRIFDRFIQLDTGTTRIHPGHGLGLSIVRSLVELLHGGIQVESSEGNGALFRFTLPFVASSDKAIFIEGGSLFIFDEMNET